MRDARILDWPSPPGEQLAPRTATTATRYIISNWGLKFNFQIPPRHIAQRHEC